MSGISSRTQQIDAMGKVRHVFLINSSQEQMQMSQSRDKIGFNSKRLKDGKKKSQKRRKRPSSSRLRRNKGFHIDLINEKGSNGEDINTVQGGSSSRDMGHRRGSDDQAFESNPLSLPDLKKVGQEFATDTHRSNKANFISSSDQKEEILIIEKDKEGAISLKQNASLVLNSSSQPHQTISENEHESRVQNKLSTLPPEGATHHTQQSKAQLVSIDITAKANDDARASVHNSINDYLKNEEISRVQILDVPKPEYKTLNPAQQVAENRRD